MQSYLLHRQVGLMVAALAVLADALSKGEALYALARGQLPVWLVPEQLGMAFAWNRGMSFSLLQGSAWGPWFLGLVAVAACIWFFHWLGEKEGGSWHQGGLGLVIGGAVGNLLDRIQHGAVVDFIVVNPQGLFPYTFNVADACITVGVILLLAHGFWAGRGQSGA